MNDPVYKLKPRFAVEETDAGFVITPKEGKAGGAGAKAGKGGNKGGKAKGGDKGAKGGDKGAKGGSKGGKGGDKAAKEAAPAPAAAAGAGAAPQSFVRRDRLRAIEKEVQAMWAEEKTFEANAPAEGEPDRPKYMATFPYPYMNGKLHLGHMFSVTKAEFMCHFQRLQGKNVLFPFGFHCTGMPIQAAANRLKRELEDPVDPAAAAPEEEEAAEVQIGVFKSKRTKAVSKTGGGRISQFDIMLKSGLEEADIPAFKDPMHWLRYFPPRGKADLIDMGLSVDWRRSFITTSVNKYYDSFIRWQFGILKAKDYIRFGKRATVFSISDGQACADHDRASGEGANPQQYTLIKLEVAQPLPEALAALAPHAHVYLVAATLRPETMYGQTNCFLLPTGTYGAFLMRDDSVFVCSHRSMLNMAYQDLTPEHGKVHHLATYTGAELMGLPLKAPYAKYDIVYTLPLLTISMGKGTGVVTSVPSDSPDDYAALRDLQKKAALRDKYGVTEAMVSFDVVPIINIPGFGDAAAVKVCEDLKIMSQNDKEQLAVAKEQVYTKGFYEGTLLVGSQAGKKVIDAKDAVREELLAAGLAALYYEPERKVVPRSAEDGEEAVVTYLDQWFLDYGDADWKALVEAHLTPEHFEAYNPKTLAAIKTTVGWLREWACSRWFGLGTQVPWDEQFVIESLSDSTIYMAYYTIAHLLQRGVFDGSEGNFLGIAPKNMTPPVWDYIFLGKPYPMGCGINEPALATMRREFHYWYPVDLRVSGKDLIGNHLTMSLFNHAAVWGGTHDRMPASYFTNGHVQVNACKMSKGLGNFITMADAVARYSADAARLALAVAGDDNEDANFERQAADAGILRLTTELDYMQEAIDGVKAGKYRTGLDTLNAWDRAFDSRINLCITKSKAAFEGMMFRDGMQHALFAMQAARDEYRNALTLLDLTPHASIMERFVNVQTVLIAPVCPHFAEHVWRKTLGNTTTVFKTMWPIAGVVDEGIIQQNTFLQASLHNFRAFIVKAKAKPTKVTIVLSSKFPAWMDWAVERIQEAYSPDAPHFDPTFLKGLTKDAAKVPGFKPFVKFIMPFAGEMTRNMVEGGPGALVTAIPFDEKAVFDANLEYVKRNLALDVATVDAEDAAGVKTKRPAVPGKPQLCLE